MKRIVLALLMLGAPVVGLAQFFPPLGGVGTITTGGTAVTLYGGVPPANGWEICNPSASEDLWVSDITTAAINGGGSYIAAKGGGCYKPPVGSPPLGPVSAIAATTGHTFSHRRW